MLEILLLLLVIYHHYQNFCFKKKRNKFKSEITNFVLLYYNLKFELKFSHQQVLISLIMKTKNNNFQKTILIDMNLIKFE